MAAVTRLGIDQELIAREELAREGIAGVGVVREENARREGDSNRAATPMQRRIPVCGASAIVDGQSTSVLVRGVEYVLWRGPSGALCAANAVCPHRGASLAGGVVIDGELACPVHGWRFDGTGKNVYRPDGQPLATMQLHCLVVHEEEDMVYLEPDGIEALP